MNKVRVLIVDDESLVRRALHVFLDGEDDIDVVGDAEDGEDAVEKARRLSPDVVLMDLHMPKLDGVEATARIIQDSPRTRILAVTTFGTIDSILPALRAGASGYLLKDTEPELIVEAVRELHAGSGVLSPLVTERLIRSLHEHKIADLVPLAPHEQPSERELDVLALLSEGKSNSEIALAMNLAEGTVKSHLSNLMAKWDARDRVQLLIRGVRAGLVTFE